MSSHAKVSGALATLVTSTLSPASHRWSPGSKTIASDVTFGQALVIRSAPLHLRQAVPAAAPPHTSGRASTPLLPRTPRTSATHCPPTTPALTPPPRPDYGLPPRQAPRRPSSTPNISAVGALCPWCMPPPPNPAAAPRSAPPPPPDPRQPRPSVGPGQPHRAAQKPCPSLPR